MVARAVVEKEVAMRERVAVEMGMAAVAWVAVAMESEARAWAVAAVEVAVVIPAAVGQVAVTGAAATGVDSRTRVEGCLQCPQIRSYDPSCSTR